ncbi:MAG: cation:proton antiporter [Bacteroidetes bacterium]|uniref:cation:proton antiporter domain-containing protein n=1 Tax=Phnomibacter sp. TaxID=2836217 RepID=UPI002FDEA10E|nr:cation:proton antiporter [Bacteroidota bacterium]
MAHLPALIHDLALILITGAVATLLFRQIKQPLVLGYIIAGFFVGPYFHFLPTVADTENIKTLAEIGVIFLLFSLGLEFSFKKLMRVGGTASITAFVEIAFITVAGFFTGKWLGWSSMDSLFLGGMLASSSTTIIIRAFDELGVKNKQFARIVFGVLVVEDIVVILLMVLLSTIAVTQQFQGSEIIFTVSKLLFFLAIWFIAGIFLLPTILKKAKHLLDEETLLILALGLCLGMVILATQVGFSAELGAFIMGSIIAETTFAEKVEHLIKSVKDLFGAIFFVSVGMMINPEAIVQYGWPVFAVTMLTLFGKLFSTTLGAVLSGQPLKQSVQVGMSMAQIGEFAFIVATLGLSLGVISDFLFPVAVGASAVTTFTTPYLIKYSEPLYNWLEKKLPAKWTQKLNRYASSTQKIQAESEWKTVVAAYSKIMVSNLIIIVAIVIASIRFIWPFFQTSIDNIQISNLLSMIATLVLSAPFIVALINKQPKTHAHKELWLNKAYNRGPLLIIEIFRALAGISIIVFVVFKVYNNLTAIVIAVPISGVIIWLFAKRLQLFYQRIESRFLRNLHARETEEYQSLTATVQRNQDALQTELYNWDAHIVQLEVPAQAWYIGRTLQELMWREQFGINIVYIKRGEGVIATPDKQQILLPHDLIGLIATDNQLQNFKPVFDTLITTDNAQLESTDTIGLEKVLVNEYTQLKGLSIRNSGIREKTNGLVIGIIRKNQQYLNPDSSMVFEWGDMIWIVGDKKKIQYLKKPLAS